MCSTILTPGSSQVGPFVLGAPIRLAANPVAKKAQSKSLEGAQGTLPLCCRLALLRRGAALAPLRSTPKYLAPPSRRAGPPCFAPQAVLTALDQEQELGGTSGQTRSRRGLGEMTRRKREIIGLTNERDFPHLVELTFPPGGFRSVFLEINAFHRERRIPVRRGRNQHEVEQFHIRFCFPDTATADAFRNRFGGDA
jgi:hypothetical protein